MMNREWKKISIRTVPRLRAGEVHVWLLRFAKHPPRQSRLCTPDERNRASVFLKNEGRLQFLWGRYLTRTLAQRYLGLSNNASLLINEDKKPFFSHYAHLHFNISHSARYVAVAFSSSGSVGIDIESKLVIDCMLPKRSDTNSDERDRFLGQWTRLEACAKCTGQGLTGSALLQHDLSLTPAFTDLSCIDLPPFRELIGAVASRSPVQRIDFQLVSDPVSLLGR